MVIPANRRARLQTIWYWLHWATEWFLMMHFLERRELLHS